MMGRHRTEVATMKIQPVVSLISVFFCVLLNSMPARAGIVELLPRIKPAIVGVGSVSPLAAPRIKLLGTGFAVADGLHIVTNAHVIPGSLAIEKGEALAVFLRDGDSVKARKVEQVASDKEHDLTLLKMEGTPLPALRMGHFKDVREGETYYFTGFPIGAVLGLHPATHRAGLAAIAPIYSPPATAKGLTAKLIRRAEDPFLMFQLDAVAYPGNSGSPLYDGETGEVIGVINAIYIKGAKENALKDPSGISYAIPAKYVRALLEQAGLQP